MRERTGAAESTQRGYGKTAGIAQQKHIAIIPAKEGQDFIEAKRAAHWQYGRNVFELKDHRGIQGEPGQMHLARRLPGSYVAPYERARRGRLRKINRRLDLVNIGARGNGSTYERIFHDTPAAAGAAYNRDPERDHYWRAGMTAGGVGIWAMLPAQRGK
jgi:hypothetical protein